MNGRASFIIAALSASAAVMFSAVIISRVFGSGAPFFAYAVATLFVLIISFAAFSRFTSRRISADMRALESENERLKNSVNSLTDRLAEFDAITRDMSEAMIVINREGAALTMNRAAEKLLRASDYIGRSICELAPELPLSRDSGTGLYRLSKSSDICEIRGREYQIFANPVIDENGGAGGVVLLLTDVTETHRAEHTRREFTANVSHELKTPLTAILGYAEIMKNGIAPEDMLREFAGRIHFEATRLIKLVEDILHLSRLDESDARTQTETVRLLEAANEITKRLAPQAHEKRVKVDVSGDDIRVSGDSQMLEELLYNLIDNAIKYNVEGGSVFVRAKRGQKLNTVEVEDTGIGIDPVYHERIFERFFRVDKSRSKQIGGTGLGLSIVKHAAMHHHAQIEVKSAPSKGTRITIGFPVD